MSHCWNLILNSILRILLYQFNPPCYDNNYLLLLTGGAGEGVQTLNPENPVRNKNEVKTDATLPAYCNPPNPCPVGYSGKLCLPS